MRKAQISVETLILVGIIFSILAASLVVYLQSIRASGTKSSEIYGMGVQLVSQIRDFQQMESDSWQTLDIRYAGDNGKILVLNQNELVIQTPNGDYPFFVGRSERIVIPAEGIHLDSGINRLKLSQKGGIICVSKLIGDCDYTYQDCPDADEDGYTTCDGDCEDYNPAIHPGAEDICDMIDNDCDGRVDEDGDEDNDGWIIFWTSECADYYPPGYPQDCLPQDPFSYPGAPELCDGKDNDCDLSEDEGLSGDACLEHGFFGICSEGIATCVQGGWICDVSPIEELCSNGQDDDCDGYTDEEDEDCGYLFFLDFNDEPDPYTADICKGNCQPIDANSLSLSEGISDTALNVSNLSQLRYNASGNINLTNGTLEFFVHPAKKDVWWDEDTRYLLSYRSKDPLQQSYLKVYKTANPSTLRIEWYKPPFMPVKFQSKIYTHSWSDTDWHMFAIAWDSTGVFVYIDGKNIGSTNLHYWPAQLDYLTIGSQYISPGYANYADFLFENVKVFGHKRDSTQILDDFQRVSCDYVDTTCLAAGGLGDVNDDGCRGYADTVLMKEFIEGEEGIDPNVIACMDLDQNCKIEWDDYSLMKPYENCTNGVDDDCDLWVDEDDPDCSLTFFSDFNDEPDWLVADIALGSKEPLLSDGPALSSGIEGHAVDVTIPAKLMYSAEGNMDMNQGTLEFWAAPAGTNPWTELLSNKTSTLITFAKEDYNQYTDLIRIESWIPPMSSASDLGFLNFFLSKYSQVSNQEVNMSRYVNLEEDWHHFALTWEPSTEPDLYEYKVYVDGKPRTSDFFSRLELETFSLGNKISLGLDGEIIFSNYSNISIDNLKMYDRPLQRSEIWYAHDEFMCDIDPEARCPEDKYGYINDNTCIDGSDHDIVQSYIESTPMFFTPEKLPCMDMNQDCRINQLDLKLIQEATTHCADCITPIDTCSSDQPWYCDSTGHNVTDCVECLCASGYTCNQDTGTCESDGSSPIFKKGELEPGGQGGG